MPTLQHLQLSKDSNEIDLENVPDTYSSSRKFNDYGIGSLRNHSLVVKYFGKISSKQSMSIPTEEVLKCLLKFITSSSTHSNSTHFISEFSDFICSIYFQDNTVNCTSSFEKLRKGGVLFGELSEEVLCMRYLLNHQMGLMSRICGAEIHTKSSLKSSSKSKRKHGELNSEDVPVHNSSLQCVVVDDCTSEVTKPHLIASLGDRIASTGLVPQHPVACDDDWEPRVLAELADSIKLSEATDADAPEAVPAVCVQMAAAAPAYVMHAAENCLTAQQQQMQTTPAVWPFEARMMMGTSAAEASEEALEVVGSEELRPLLPHLLPFAAEGGTEHLQAVGRWGESLVHRLLLSRLQLPASPSLSEQPLQWLNQHGESRASYDFIVTATPSAGSAGRGRSTFIEVKTTRFSDLNVFELSLWEWQFATALPRVNYHVYRVFNAADPRLIAERRVKLCLAV
eukprot:CAMPEP_0170062060 /NCGR_PEP_ID=MMETSP0019_2-20121128/3420_1 /TAXON_ID=98059 /ORGANISM="Dinobryon sp., Strain UTEXLB2267" /LENGTH=453 /DNA_ID=CAMNT_0010268097 /DNA_START=110 /DNA_END=1472 /DNA_ORIENTATION=-